MRVLFLESHAMWIHGLPNGFRDLGHEVKVSGEVTKAKLAELIAFQPQLIINIGWTFENGSQSKQKLMREIIETSKAPFVYWDTEGSVDFERFTRPFIQATTPDFIFTVFPDKMETFAKLHFKSAPLDFGYHATVHHPMGKDERFTHSISLVANAYFPLLKKCPKDFVRYKSVKAIVVPLLKAGIPVYFYGREWIEVAELFDCTIPEECIRGFLPYRLAKNVYNSSDIVLGLQNRSTQMTQRTYEILASDGFLLTYDTPATQTFGSTGKHFISVKEPEETLQQIEFYLNHPEERKQIQIQGRAQVSQHSYSHRAEYMIDVLQKENILEKTAVIAN